ncbi:hypothetical protein TNCV_4018241 [Trichonephila clavipes]|nr:hypothetical protein TNCV_4018241 [Trichonephila clavipes]
MSFLSIANYDAIVSFGQFCNGRAVPSISERELETHHLIGTSAHAPQRPVVTNTERGPEGLSPHELLRH